MPKTFVLTKQSPLLQEDVDCNYCHTDLLLDDQVTACDRCGSPHHSDCWEANGNQCATFGCVGGAGAVRRAPAARPTTPVPATRTQRNTQANTVVGRARISSNRRRIFGLFAFVAMIFYTIIFEAGPSSTTRNFGIPSAPTATVRATPIPDVSMPASPLTSPLVANAVANAPFTTCDQTVGIDLNDCAVLVKLHEDTDGPNWLLQDGWMQSNLPCDWEGVSCTDLRVTRLHLSRNGLNGEIPAELGNLSALTALTMSSNQLRGEIPAELGQLSNLTLLFLSENELSGEIPRALGQLSNLSRLHVSNNHLSGTIPPELGRLASVKWLDLKSNQLSGVVPRMFACSPMLASLTQLNIANNQLNASTEETASCLDGLDEDWAVTQTVPPTNVQARVVSEMTLRLSWAQILFNEGDGYYEVGRSTDGGATFTVVTQTQTKVASSLILINEVSTDTDYLYAVRTVTPAFQGQKNALTSEFSEWVSVQVAPE